MNNLLKFINVNIPVDHPAVSWFTRFFMNRELKMYLNKLRRDDSQIEFREIQNMDEPTLNRICFERAIPISILNIEQKKHEFKKWHTISNLNNVPNTLLLYIRVVKFNQIKNASSIKNDEYEILRRCKNEIYFYEKQRIYERTLGTNSLNILVDMLNERKKFTDSWNEFSSTELHDYAKLLVSLKERNKKLSQEIKDAYKHGNKMVSYMENVIIIDYLIQCKQKELEDLSPELSKKAIEIFGNQFYYNFPNDIEELKTKPKIIQKLEERREEIEKQFENSVSMPSLRPTV